MATASAIMGGIGVATSLFQTIKGAVDSKNARESANELRANRPEATNPYAMLKPSTYGANIAQEQSLRGLATSTEAASRAGIFGQGILPKLARENALTGQNIAANLDLQVKQIHKEQADGELLRQQQEINYYNQDMAGYANQYNYGQANVMGGISNLAGTLSSGFGAGGAFTGMFGGGAAGMFGGGAGAAGGGAFSGAPNFMQYQPNPNPFTVYNQPTSGAFGM